MPPHSVLCPLNHSLQNCYHECHSGSERNPEDLHGGGRDFALEYLEVGFRGLWSDVSLILAPPITVALNLRVGSVSYRGIRCHDLPDVSHPSNYFTHMLSSQAAITVDRGASFHLGHYPDDRECTMSHTSNPRRALHWNLQLHLSQRFRRRA